MKHSTLLAGAALLVLVGCAGEEPEPEAKRDRTAPRQLPANLCPTVARSASPQLALEEDSHRTRNDTNPTYSYCVLLGIDPKSTERGEVAVSTFVRSYGDLALDRAADRVDEELSRQCDELAQEHPETERNTDGTCSYHATTKVDVGGFAEASTATAVVRLPRVNGVAGINMRIDGDDAGRSRAEVLAIGQGLASTDFGE